MSVERELLAFLVAKELGMLCRCGAPAMVESDRSMRAPVCDECAVESPMPDYKDLKHASRLRRFLKGEV